MATIIHSEKLQEGRQIAETCVHFGFCTSVCPTYVLDGEENDSPRGRIALIKEMLDSGGQPKPTTVKHLDRCLSCLSCVTTCAVSVDYRKLIDTARDYIESSGARSRPERMLRKALAYILTSPRLLRWSLRLAKPIHGPAGGLPGPAGALARLSGARGLNALARRGKGETPSLPEAATPSPPVKKVALLDGCAQSVLGEEINDATRRLLARLGVQVVDSGLGSACCGALSLHLGDTAKATSQAEILIEQWDSLLSSKQIDAIVVTTSGCGSVISHYRDLFANDPLRLERATRVERACLDITQLLTQIPLPVSDRHLGARVAYHDSCSLKHGQKITAQPRAILKKAGFAVMDIAEAHLCCGSAGTYNILQPEIAQRLGKRKTDNIRATNPDVVAAGNMGCLIQISLYAETPIAHVVQLIDWATGGPAPRGLESFQPVEKPVPPPSEEAYPTAEPVSESETTDLLW
ncbi:MAG TPA: heterodisulfide reductase-related iron-sulfur binding cluster [Eoetvoesiella sp.]|uniref:heterodisulfide reductase-related iron-sulfur binding cluster n=1 Tax=Eoetvoesiella sp. TaxID=1966355 RepID=UPI002D19A8BF|nr:heterodisulfide reductase-related iron-sulfur binding cluster [Eoetvoesiella sp.]HWK61055.1 heterodisulfide reductase-related iron-sulfur binding cluster [Eoetvoesiella sp.]